MVTPSGNERELSDLDDDAGTPAPSFDLSEPDIDSPVLIDDEISDKELQRQLNDGLASYAKFLRSRGFKVPALAAFVTGKERVDLNDMKRSLSGTEDTINRLQPYNDDLLNQVQSAQGRERGEIEARHRDAMKTNDGYSYQRSMDVYERNLASLRSSGTTDPTNGKFEKISAELLKAKSDRDSLLRQIKDAQYFEGYLEVARGRTAEKNSKQTVKNPIAETRNSVKSLFGSWKMW